MTNGTQDTRDTGTNEDTAPSVQDTTTPDAVDANTEEQAEAAHDENVTADAATEEAPAEGVTDLTPNPITGFVTVDNVSFNPDFATPDEALAVGQKDIQAVAENPAVPNVRPADENLGGEGFGYGFPLELDEDTKVDTEKSDES